MAVVATRLAAAVDRLGGWDDHSVALPDGELARRPHGPARDGRGRRRRTAAGPAAGGAAGPGGGLTSCSPASGHRPPSASTWSPPRSADRWSRTAAGGSATSTCPHGTDYAFSVDGGPPRPDPRSAWQPHGVHGASRVYDPATFTWSDDGWSRCRRARARDATSCTSARSRDEGTLSLPRSSTLDELVALGVDLVELMPVAAVPRHARLGVRRRRDVRGARAVRRTGRPPARSSTPPTPAVSASASTSSTTTWARRELPRRVRPLLHRRAPDAVGRPRSTSTVPGPTRCAAWVCDSALRWFRDFHVDALRLDAVHALIDRSRPAPPRAAVRRGRRPVRRAGPPAVPDRRVRPERPRLGDPDGRGRLGHDRAVGRRRPPRDPRAASPASGTGTTATSAPPSVLRKALTSVFVHDGALLDASAAATGARPVPAGHRRPPLRRGGVRRTTRWATARSATGRRRASTRAGSQPRPPSSCCPRSARCCSWARSGAPARRGSSSPTTPSRPGRSRPRRSAPRVRRARLGRPVRRRHRGARPAGPRDVPRQHPRPHRARRPGAPRARPAARLVPLLIALRRTRPGPRLRRPVRHRPGVGRRVGARPGRRALGRLAGAAPRLGARGRSTSRASRTPSRCAPTDRSTWSRRGTPPPSSRRRTARSSGRPHARSSSSPDLGSPPGRRRSASRPTVT